MTEMEDNPLLATLPPATDYLTYLTVLEYNLTVDRLPTLHQVLQDAELTAAIGWDLVQLLLPLLPHSEQCLQDVARLGNPREVVLKVTEALRQIDFTDEPGPDGDEKEAPEDTAESSLAKLAISSPSDKPAKPGESSNSQSEEPVLPLPVLQYQTLLSMLSVLHPRIKTKYPSRFLSTSLQAVLATYSETESYSEDLTSAIVMLVKTLSGTKRPHFPPRRSSNRVTSASMEAPLADPEENPESISGEETAVYRRLLQSFITHVLESYMGTLTSDDDVPGLALSSRLQEKLHPERVIPGKRTYAELFAEEKYELRSTTVGQLVAIAQDLELDTHELYTVVMDPRPEESGSPNKEDEPPSSAEEIPLSKTGSLYLLTARVVFDRLFGTSDASTIIPIFPSHAMLLQNFLQIENPIQIGLEPESLIDSILVLGLLAIEDNQVGEPTDTDQFTKYLQTTSLVSSKNPSPSLRYHAHYLTSSVLRSHPSDVVRLSFIRDTLEHCPFENLKTSAVSWFKGETLEANISTLSPKTSGLGLGLAVLSPALSDDGHPSIFATPVALSTVSPFLFPDLTHDLTQPSLSECWTQFELDLSFYLATLNLYYLLLNAKPLHSVLDIAGLHETSDIGGSYLQPLRAASARFREGLADGGELHNAEGEKGVKAGLLDLMLLDDTLDRVTNAVKALNAA